MPLPEHRLDGLQSDIEARGLDGLYTEDPVHIRYLSGFHADDSALLVDGEGVVLVTDFRYLQDARDNLPGVDIIEVEQGAGCMTAACERASERGWKRMGFESALLSHASASQLAEAFAAVGELVPVTGLVERLRAVKDEDEIEAMRTALRIAQTAFERLRKEARPGLSEKHWADRLETLLREAGAKKSAFDAAVLVQERGSLPHGQPGDRTWEAGEALLIDFGALHDGYHCDMTRMLYLESPSNRFREIHPIVREAQARAIAAVRPGVRACDIDHAARDHIARAGFGPAFRHGLGHGVGLRVHESPRISGLSQAPVGEGMVFTIEPGIYLSGEAGVRIEDMVRVTADGVEVLSSLPSSLEDSRI